MKCDRAASANSHDRSHWRDPPHALVLSTKFFEMPAPLNATTPPRARDKPPSLDAKADYATIETGCTHLCQRHGRHLGGLSTGSSLVSKAGCSDAGVSLHSHGSRRIVRQKNDRAGPHTDPQAGFQMGD
jgi:hypothetical protein